MQRECRNSSLIFLSLFSHLPAPTPKEPCDGSSSDWHQESIASKLEGKGDLLYIQWAYGYKRDVPTLFFFSISSCHLAPGTDTVTEVHWRASWVKPHLSSQKTKMSPRDGQHWEGHGEERIGLSDSIKSFVNLWDQLWARMCGIDSIHHVEDLEIWINRPNLRLVSHTSAQSKLHCKGHENWTGSPQKVGWNLQPEPNQINCLLKWNWHYFSYY